MDQQKLSSVERLVGFEWIDTLREAVRREGLDYEPAFLRIWLRGDGLIALVRSLGGSVRPVESPFHWVLHNGFNPRRDPWAEWVPEERRRGSEGVSRDRAH